MTTWKCLSDEPIVYIRQTGTSSKIQEPRSMFDQNFFAFVFIPTMNQSHTKSVAVISQSTIPFKPPFLFITKAIKP